MSTFLLPSILLLIFMVVHDGSKYAFCSIPIFERKNNNLILIIIYKSRKKICTLLPVKTQLRTSRNKLLALVRNLYFTTLITYITIIL